MIKKRYRGSIFQQNSKRNSLPDRSSSSGVLRWPRPTKVSDLKNCTSAKRSEDPSNGGSTLATDSQRNNQSNSKNEFVRSCNSLLRQPRPVKANNIEGQDRNYACHTVWDINSRLNRQQWFNDSDQQDEFTRELEDRIEADLEVENIFDTVSQVRSLSLGKSLPDRPENPIINDKLFIKENTDGVSSMNEKLLSKSQKQIPMSKYRECSSERQRRILQEDFEAEYEINQLLLSPEFSVQIKNSSSGSMSCSSEFSSFENEFSNIFGDEISLKN